VLRPPGYGPESNDSVRELPTADVPLIEICNKLLFTIV